MEAEGGMERGSSARLASPVSRLAARKTSSPVPDTEANSRLWYCGERQRGSSAASSWRRRKKESSVAMLARAKETRKRV